jgi:hypothetical protein
VLTSGDAVCGELPLASVAAFDCGALSAAVTLDNSRMPVATAFTIRSGERYLQQERTITVLAGDTIETSVALVVDAVNDVVVTLANGARIASASGECGSWVHDPRAVVGAFDCGALDVAVTLDNSRSSARTALVVQRTPLGDDHPDSSARYVLTAGEVRVVHVVLKRATVTAIAVTVGVDEGGSELVSVQGPLCGLLTVGPVDCETLAFPVTLVNDDADHSSTRQFRVSSSRFPKDRQAFNQLVSVARGEQQVLTIPVEALHGGDLRVAEAGTIDGAMLYQEPVEVRCPEGSGGTGSGTPTGSGAGRLAATGVDGILPLLALGLGLVVLGAGLVGAGRMRARTR